MQRRTILQIGLGTALSGPLFSAMRENHLESAAGVLRKATATGQIRAAALHVRQRDRTFTRSFGASKSEEDIFLLASISKPISVAAFMTLYDQGQIHLDDSVQQFIPEFSGDGRDEITIRHLFTHVSGLPDQLPENETMRKRHASLSEFVDKAIRTPLLFRPGSQYSYSSMGILVASEVAQRVSGIAFPRFVHETVFQPLDMKRSALGLGRFMLKDTMQCQVENAAPESGSGDPSARKWDWNSSYWRNLGSPWGGAHGSAADVARFFAAFLTPEGKLLKPATSRLMLRNHNTAGLRPRGLGFALGTRAASPGCSEQTFGHAGATGTLAWADPATQTICIVLTTLPGRAANPHPRKLASDLVARAAAHA